MHLHRSGSDVVVQAPAKLNLFFEVLGRREDGYHEIETLVTPIEFYDTLVLTDTSDGQVTLTCQKVYGVWGAAAGLLDGLPDGPENLVFRAVELLRRRAGVDRGASLRLVKRIPTAAGLGGGSSDAAAALMAANVAWSLGQSPEQLAALGAELGSDVPLFFTQGPAVCRGRGERVQPIHGMGPLHFVLLRPPAGLSTAAVYRACQPPRQPRSVQPLLEALARGDLPAAGRLLFNRLEPAAETLSPWIGRLREVVAQTDCLGHQMSGSGTCYFALCRHARHARRLARRLRASGIGIAMAVRGGQTFSSAEEVPSSSEA
jgi:4-diphosphocytidyl-2-C-methyl-D-erythritol kinase